jgi:hypothetical protein
MQYLNKRFSVGMSVAETPKTADLDAIFGRCRICLRPRKGEHPLLEDVCYACAVASTSQSEPGEGIARA